MTCVVETFQRIVCEDGTWTVGPDSDGLGMCDVQYSEDGKAVESIRVPPDVVPHLVDALSSWVPPRNIGEAQPSMTIEAKLRDALAEALSAARSEKVWVPDDETRRLVKR